MAVIQIQCAFKQWNNRGTLNSLVIQDSQFRGGVTYLSPNVTNQFIGIINVLFENATVRFYPYSPTTLRLANSTFKSGFLDLHCIFGSDWRVHDNIFDNTTLSQGGAGTVTNDYNGYLTNATRLTPNGANDVVQATNVVNFQTGALGAYYLPSNSLFIDAGSVTNAGFVGLWHYTTQVDQTKDAGSRLDLGFHYVAVNANGQPIDSDGDTFPDYHEDASGNGAFDAGETDWQTYNSPNGLSGTPALKVFTPLK